ncbi:hypothetical protein D9M69_610280 [compost metagenome]
MRSTESIAFGAGKSMRPCISGRSDSVFCRRTRLWRAAMKPFQLAIARSTGASARAESIEPAMMMPGVACWLITSQAPTARMPDCSSMRSTLLKTLKPEAISLARRCSRVKARFSSCQRRRRCGPIPRTEMTSALRRALSAMRLRLEECLAASSTGRLETSSVSSVMAASTIAPASAVTPSQKWKAKQMAM